jgi:hypothetical protein
MRDALALACLLTGAALLVAGEALLKRFDRHIHGAPNA